MLFHDRADAGRKLAAALAAYRGQEAIVFALPRGGVPVAAEIAQALEAPLNIILVRKIGAPDQPELAMGAVVDGTDPIIIRNERVIRLMRISEEQFQYACARELTELESRRRRFPMQGRQTEIAGRIAIVVDDGVATGATARAALQAMRKHEPKELILAVPVAAPEMAAALRSEVDKLVCLAMPEGFEAVGPYYSDFRQVRDDEVNAILSRFSTTPTTPV